ncbi:hypothetical protein B0A55_06034 [Friedmanniomyces simplex]|uniref:Zn(2)-C6 fungal-type domain-containing protein n=1 Tax=Friedmanniomyces simplex TaxID=329884 RepID=A0A4U0X6G4_9PEZI|nr:hypothetical protein B0A55_06034 [Friedmanniomyces simplex]
MPPRPIRPKDEQDTSDSGIIPSDLKATKRRAVSSACLQCRKRKSKCDGALPACSTCVAVYRTECSYDADSDHRRKGALKRDIQCLQQQKSALEVIVASLRSLPEEEAVSLLQSVRGESSFEVVAASLRTNVRLPHSYAPQTLEADFAQQISQPMTIDSISTPASFSCALSREQSSENGHEALADVKPDLNPGSWFSQPQDAEFIEHLLNLYFSWPYHDDANQAMSPNIQQAARPTLFIECRSRLSELASDMVNTFYAPRERFTSRRLAAAYAQYQEWHHNLPEAFRLENTALPHVLVLHMYYNACVLHLFRPYIKLDLRGAGLYPHETCTHCANEISSIMNALRAISGLRRVSLTVCSWIMTASTIHLLNLPSDVATHNLSQGMHDLQTISVNHQFAARCIDIVRSLAVKWNITLPEGANAIPGFRELATQPLKSPTTAFFAASIPRVQSSEGRSASGSSVSSNQPPDTPFAPPQHPPSTFPTYYSDPTAPMDPSQVQHAFWTPFPAQGVPAVSFHDLSFDFTSSPMDVMQNMQLCGGSGDSSLSSHAGHQMVSDVGMGSTMGTLGPANSVGAGGTDWDWR